MFQASIISVNYFIFAQLGEPASRRNLKRIADIITKRQGGFNLFDFAFGFLDGVLSYSTVLRTIVFYAIGVRKLSLVSCLWPESDTYRVSQKNVSTFYIVKYKEGERFSGTPGIFTSIIQCVQEKSIFTKIIQHLTIFMGHFVYKFMYCLAISHNNFIYRPQEL